MANGIWGRAYAGSLCNRRRSSLETDMKLAEYFDDNERFADIFNGHMFGGSQIILPKLLENDEVRSKLKIKKQGNKNDYRYILRDIKKKYKGTTLIVLGIENQSDVHYAMPVRVLVYDGSQYKEQWEKIKKKHRINKDLQGAEFLSGFSKKDKLVPVITLVVYWGKEPWDGARDLHELFPEDAIPEKIRPFLNNYKINLLDVRHDSPENFKTDLKQCFQFLQNEGDKEALKKLLEDDKAYQSLDEETFKIISLLSGEKKLLNKLNQYENKEGGYNMCQAFADMRMEGRLEGISIGRTEGLSIGRKEALIQVFINAINRGMSEEDAKAIAELDDELMKVAKEKMKEH